MFLKKKERKKGISKQKIKTNEGNYLPISKFKTVTKKNKTSLAITQNMAQIFHQ